MKRLVMLVVVLSLVAGATLTLATWQPGLQDLATTWDRRSKK